MNTPPIPIPNDLKKAVRIFSEAGYQCWLVGGAVRDGLLGRETDDFDLATNAEPEEVRKLFHRTIPTGIEHGTITILLGSHQFETTTFRRDGRYRDGRRPDGVSYSDDIREDLARRDFTINAIAWDLINKRILDPHNGRRDLRQRTVRAIGDPAKRFGEDALRMIRACRLAAQLDFTVTHDTLKAIEPAQVRGLSAERIWDEMKKILSTPQPSAAFRLFRETGLIRIMLPELGSLGNPAQDFFDQCLATCDAIPEDRRQARAAALFCSVDKPSVEKNPNHRHAMDGASITEKVLKRLKASNADTNGIVRLVQHHRFRYTDDWTDADIRRFMIRVGPDILDDLMALRLAGAWGDGDGQPSPKEHLKKLKARIQEIQRRNDALTVKDLDTNGRILMRELGIPPSPLLGTLLQHLLNQVVEDPAINRKEVLIDMARRWVESQSP